MTQEIDARDGEKKSIESVRKAAEDKTRKEARGKRGRLEGLEERRAMKWRREIRVESGWTVAEGAEGR